MPTTSTVTPLSLLSSNDKSTLCDAYIGKPLSSLRTPALIVDRTRFKANCERVTAEAKRRGMKFRAHVKSQSTFLPMTVWSEFLCKMMMRVNVSLMLGLG